MCIQQEFTNSALEQSTEASITRYNELFSIKEDKEQIPVPVASLSLIPQLGSKTKNKLINNNKQQDRQPIKLNEGIGDSIKVLPVTIRVN